MILPDFSSRQRARSVPFIPADFLKSVTNTRPAATAGPANPPFMGVRQATVNPFSGNFSRTPDSVQIPIRPFPRHSGQSSAKAETKAGLRMHIATNRCPIVRFILFDLHSSLFIVSGAPIRRRHAGSYNLAHRPRKLPRIPFGESCKAVDNLQAIDVVSLHP